MFWLSVERWENKKHGERTGRNCYGNSERNCRDGLDPVAAGMEKGVKAFHRHTIKFYGDHALHRHAVCSDPGRQDLG